MIIMLVTRRLMRREALVRFLGPRRLLSPVVAAVFTDPTRAPEAAGDREESRMMRAEGPERLEAAPRLMLPVPPAARDSAR